MTMSDTRKTQYVLAEENFYVGTKTSVFQSCVNEDELDDLQSSYQGGSWFKKIITRLSPSESPASGYSTEATQSPAQPRANQAATSSSSSSSSQPWEQPTTTTTNKATSSSENIGNNANSTSDISKNSEVLKVVITIKETKKAMKMT